MVAETCETCEFNFWGMCAGNREDGLYGTFLTREQYAKGCSWWGISFDAFVDQEEAKRGV